MSCKAFRTPFKRFDSVDHFCTCTFDPSIAVFTETEIHFYDYLIQNEKIDIDKNELENIQKMYILNETICPEIINLQSVNKIPDYPLLYDFLENNGFIFYNREDNKLPWKSSIPV